VPLRHASNIFAPPANPAHEPDGPAEPPPTRRATGRRYVHFVIVAGSRAEMAAKRSALDYYGQQRTDWSPYWPAVEGPLGASATRIAGERRFDYEISDITKLRERIDRAKRRNQVVVLLVDAWALELDEHQRALAEYDEHSESTNALVIPFNVSDSETLDETTFLQSRVAMAIPKTLRRRDPVMLRQNVPTQDQFSASLDEILEVAQNRIFRKGTVNSRVPRTPSRSRPILEGPTSTTDGPGQ
jgi:FxsC-like protein